MNRLQLEVQGWTTVQGITSESKLLELAHSLGHPVASPTGQLIKQLTPRTVAEARKLTLSATYGMGPFPLHTDTAFWPLPCRYLVFRATGDVRRITTVLSFADLSENLGLEFYNLAERSIWLARTPRRSFYCSMMFHATKEQCWRYDPQCMVPVNKAALRVADMLKGAMPHDKTVHLNWTEGLALVLCNWKTLHGRGPMPVDEKTRLLQRIYVE